MNYLYQYEQPGVRIENIKEIDGYTYILGWEYNSDENPVINLYLSQIDPTGRQVWQKRYIYPQAVNGGSVKIHFEDINKINSDEFLLLAYDDAQVLLFKVDKKGDLIWVNKYYDEGDIPLYYNRLSFRPRLHTLTEDHSIIVVNDIHSYNAGVRRHDYRFYKIDHLSGAVVNNKILESISPKITIRDQQSFEKTIILAGTDIVDSYVFYVSIDLEITRTYKFSLGDELPGRNYLHLFALSAVKNGRFAAIGGHWTDQGNYFFLIDFDFYDLESSGEVFISRKPWSQTAQEIERVGSDYLLHFRGNIHYFNEDLELTWVKKVEIASIGKMLFPINLKEDYIYSYYSYPYRRGYYIVSKSASDYETCQTIDLDENVFFEPRPLLIEPHPLESKEFNIISYATPDVTPKDIEVPEATEICEYPPEKPEIDVEQSSIRVKNDCILPGGMKSIIYLTLRDYSGNIINIGGANVMFNTNLGQFGSVTDYGNGVYSVDFISNSSGTATIKASVNGREIPFSVEVLVSKECGKQEADPKLATIKASLLCLNPGVKPGATITIQLFDTSGNPMTYGGDKVEAFTSLGILGEVKDNEDGTYTFELYSNYEGIAELSFTVNGTLALQSLSITVSSECGTTKPDADLTTITASPDCISPGRRGQTEITIRLYDANGNPVLDGGFPVDIQTTAGYLFNFTDHGNGTYTADLVSDSSSGAFVSFSVGGVQSQNQVYVSFSDSCDISGGDLNLSKIKAIPSCIPPDGESQAQVKVYLIDNSGNPMLIGGDNVEIQSSLGNVSSTEDNGDGTYTAFVVSTQAGIGTLTFLVNGQQALNYATVVFSKFCDVEVSLEQSTIQAHSNCLRPDGDQQTTVTVQLIDQEGNPLLIGGDNVVIHTSLGNISQTTDNGNGTYTALLSSTVTGTANLSFSIEGALGEQQAEVYFKEECEDNPISTIDLEASTIEAHPNTVVANGSDYATVKVILRDYNGVVLNLTNNNYGNYIVKIISNLGTIIPVTANADLQGNFFHAKLRSSTVGQSTVGFTVNTIQAPNTTNVKFVEGDNGGGENGTSISMDETSWLQSPNFYVQAAGSEGSDSTAGIHLRWVLRGVLGEMHLPKGNYATTQHNFNKPDDVVRLYRTRYRKIAFRLNLQEQTPTVVDSSNYLWIYRFEQRDIYIHFRNTNKYNSVRSEFDPLNSPLSFLDAYGSEVIEIDTQDELFFKVTLVVNEEGASNGSVQVETLSVSENSLLANKVVSSRQAFSGSSEVLHMNLICENGRAVRYRSHNCRIDHLEFEFYSDFLAEINRQRDWYTIGEYALTKEDEAAFRALEPNAGDVHGKWLRFNDNAHVNIENYQRKWKGVSEPGDRNIKEVVDKYIQLSDNQNNPIANETIALDESGESTTQVSNLDLLNMAGYDYHVARMLGLGTLDLDPEVFTDQYIYTTEYVSLGDLQDGKGARRVQHLSMSLPTGLGDERLPLPIELKNIVPGVYQGYDSASPINLTDDEGYSFDGKSRYVSIFTENLPETLMNVPFYVSYQQFSSHLYTDPVYGGLEYKMDDESQWRKPELSNTDEYQNVLSNGDLGANENIPLMIPEQGKPYYTDHHKKKGWYRYKAYSINWFFRASRGTIQKSIYTDIKPANNLIAPTNIRAVLVQPEKPLLLTSAQEQIMLSNLDSQDKTLVRLTFDYHSYQELIRYSIPVGSTVANIDYETDTELIFKDEDEVYAEQAEIYFRDQVPANVRGKVISVQDDPANPLLAIIETSAYTLGSQSTAQELVPHLSAGQASNFIGGMLSIAENSYIIQAVTTDGIYPIFRVYKKQITDAITEEIPSPSINPEELALPVVTNDGLFMAVENMQNTTSWGTSNPLGFKVQIGHNWDIHREVIEETGVDGIVQRKLEKTRGIWSRAEHNHTLIEKVLEPKELLDENGNLQYDEDSGELITEDVHKGLYKITFNGIQLENHPQHNTELGETSVDWYRGVARLFTESALVNNTAVKSRKTLKVGKIENVGTTNDLVIYVDDPDVLALEAMDQDPILTGENISVNFYPSYKVYLYENSAVGLTESLIPTDKDVDHSIFGVRCEDTDYNYFSPVSLPGLMMAQRIILPRPPQKPQGTDYATRPDYFGRSTYTFTTAYDHKPYGLLFYRSNDEVLLNSVYTKGTVAQIRDNLRALGEAEEAFFSDRWKNFVDFDTIGSEGDFRRYNEEGISEEGGYKFPNPDKPELYSWANDILEKLGQPVITEQPGELAAGDAKIFEFFKGAIYNAFVPLTELPVIYEHLKGNNYQPKDQKQVIKDRNGHVLPPTDPDFAMAPMMKRLGNQKTQFTDFKLDGTSENYYFYGVKEMGSQMKIGQFSPFLGPIRLVNTNAPEAPEVRQIKPILENALTATAASIRIDINAYPSVQNIRKIQLYRSRKKIDAQTIRTMSLVNSVIIDDVIVGDDYWSISDEFVDLPEIPYSEALYYRVVVEREVEYADKDGSVITEYAPSRASKLLLSMIVEVKNPPAPVLGYYSAPLNAQHEVKPVILYWDKTCYRGKYHVYKMNSQGNWVKIHSLTSNDDVIYLDLAETELGTNILLTENAEGQPIYHHFKVVAENTSGMLSQEENILTVHDENRWTDIGGIGDMEVESTFIIR